MIILCLLLISLFFSSAIFFLEMEPNISLNLNIKQHIKCYLINKDVGYNVDEAESPQTLDCG